MSHLKSAAVGGSRLQMNIDARLLSLVMGYPNRISLE
jgi:hypothetical protein